MSARGWKQATAPAVDAPDLVRVALGRDRPDGLGRFALQAIGAVRAALGGGMLVLPELSAQLLGADVDTARAANWLTRMVGGRELALGVVALAGSQAGGRGALLAQVAADASDAATLAHAANTGRLPARTASLVAAFAAASVAAEIYLAARHA